MLDMISVTEFITPTMAAEYLTRNVVNRPLSRRQVERLAFDMRAGKFETTEEGIAFDADGNLVNGQHRLHAIVKSGCGQWLRVTRNAPGILATRDRAKIRSIGDFLTDKSGAHVEQSRRVAAICNAVEHLQTRRDTRPTVAAIQTRLEDERVGIEWALDAVPARYPAFLQAAFVFAYPVVPVVVADFVQKYVTLTQLAAGSPVLVLHRAIAEMKHHRAPARLEAMLRALRCIHLALMQRSVQRITNLEEGYRFFLDRRIECAEAS